MNDIRFKLDILQKAKKAHMDEFRKSIESLATNKSNIPFKQGECSVCNELDPQIEELTLIVQREDKLKRILKDESE